MIYILFFLEINLKIRFSRINLIILLQIQISFSFRMKRCVCGSNTHMKPNSNKCPFNNVPTSSIINIINNSQSNVITNKYNIKNTYC